MPTPQASLELDNSKSEHRRTRVLRNPLCAPRLSSRLVFVLQRFLLVFFFSRFLWFFASKRSASFQATLLMRLRRALLCSCLVSFLALSSMCMDLSWVLAYEIKASRKLASSHEGASLPPNNIARRGDAFSDTRGQNKSGDRWKMRI